MSNPKFVAISGSLRSGSFNTAVLNALKERYADKADITVFPLNDIPLFNQDDEENPAQSVEALRQALRDSDGLIVSSPEYNHGTSGVLKNSLDWASRPFGQSSYKDKPVLLMTASPAATGGVRAHNELYNAFLASNCDLVAGPQIAIAAAHSKIEGDKLTDQGTLEFIDQQFAKLLAKAGA